MKNLKWKMENGKYCFLPSANCSCGLSYPCANIKKNLGVRNANRISKRTTYRFQ